MASSGTYSFNPSLGDLTLYAFNLAGIRSTELQQEHLTYAATAANMVLVDWSNKGVHLWKVDGPVVVPLVQGQAVYPVDPSTVVMLDTYAQIVGPTGGTTWTVSLTRNALDGAGGGIAVAALAGGSAPCLYLGRGVSDGGTLATPAINLGDDAITPISGASLTSKSTYHIDNVPGGSGQFTGDTTKGTSTAAVLVELTA